jgi:hypothetical protein
VSKGVLKRSERKKRLAGYGEGGGERKGWQKGKEFPAAG